MRKFLRNFINLLLPLALLGLSACTSIRSGHYVQIRRGDTPTKLARAFSLSKGELLAANPKVKFKPGNWMFIPLKRGIALFFNQEFFKDKSMQYLGQPGMFIWPVPSSKRISSYYGPRGGRNHDGIDIPARRGAHILSVADGKVIYSGNGLRGYGNLTIINHGKGIYTVYAHATKNFTKKGQKVSQGEVIATIGNTGRSSGPHLHFEVRKGDRPVDPIAYLNGTNKGLAKR